MDSLIAKAAVLQESLPYFRRFQNKVVVVKYGGHAMGNSELGLSFARDVCLLRTVGIRVIVVHGGGPQISQTLERLGIESTFSNGLRVTTEETMAVVEMVLAGRVNSELVGLFGKQGGRAVGLSGRDDSFLLAERVGGAARSGQSGAREIDLGRVGKVLEVRHELLENLVVNGIIPVVAPVGIDDEGQPLNVNADSAAGAIASAIGAQKLVLMTDVEGVRDAEGNVMSVLNAEQARASIRSGVILGGMIPKVECALDAVEQGVRQVHILDGRIRHALLLEIFTDRGVGTEIRSSPASAG